MLKLAVLILTFGLVCTGVLNALWLPVMVLILWLPFWAALGGLYLFKLFAMGRRY